MKRIGMPRSSARRAGRTGGLVEVLGLVALAMSAFVLWGGLAKAQGVLISERLAGPVARLDLRELPWRCIDKPERMAGSVQTNCTDAMIGPRPVLSASLVGHCV